MIRINAHDVARRVANSYGMVLSQLQTENRSRQFTEPRFMAVWLIRRLCPHMSYPKIGTLFGGRDHTTILNADRRAKQMMLTNPDFAFRANQIAEIFGVQHLAKIPEDAAVRIYGTHAVILADEPYVLNIETGERRDIDMRVPAQAPAWVAA